MVIGIYGRAHRKKRQWRSGFPLIVTPLLAIRSGSAGRFVIDLASFASRFLTDSSDSLFSSQSDTVPLMTLHVSMP